MVGAPTQAFCERSAPEETQAAQGTGPAGIVFRHSLEATRLDERSVPRSRSSDRRSPFQMRSLRRIALQVHRIKMVLRPLWLVSRRSRGRVEGRRYFQVPLVQRGPHGKERHKSAAPLRRVRRFYVSLRFQPEPTTGSAWQVFWLWRFLFQDNCRPRILSPVLAIRFRCLLFLGTVELAKPLDPPQ